MIRKPVVAGQFYEDEFGELDLQIKRCFEGKLGPGCTPSKRSEKSIKGIISPHAGYVFSGQCQAWGFKEIAESAFPDIFILFGLSHQGFRSCISVQDWLTPFGKVKNDPLTAEIISKKTGLPVNEDAHRNEHSIEVQLPFLQYSCKDRLRDIRIIPIIISGDIDLKKTGRLIKEALKEAGKDTVFIASSDFTHYGDNYGFVPFTDNVKENMKELDKGAIDLIIKKDTRGFLGYVQDSGATICGKHPIAGLIETIEIKKAKLLSYYTSADIMGSYSNAVGYASILLE